MKTEAHFSRSKAIALVVAALLAVSKQADANLDYVIDPGPLRYADLVKATNGFDAIVVWEGLPHPFERTSRAHELATAKTFSIAGEYFYDLPLPFAENEKRKLSDAVIEGKSNFRPWSGEKFCGGFHADYAIEWQYKGASVAQALFCFGCHEALFKVAEKIERVDLSEAGFTTLHSILSLHRGLRPAFRLDSEQKAILSPKAETPEPPRADPPPLIPIDPPVPEK